MSIDTERELYTGEYAGFITRLVAFVIDQLIITATWTIIAIVAQFVMNTFRIPQDAERFVLILVFVTNLSIYLLYYLGLWMLSGQTLGKSVMGVIIVRTDGERLNFRRALIRLVGYWISAFIFFLGYLVVLVDARRQALHDRLADTLVIYAAPSGSERATPIRDQLRKSREARQLSQE